MEKTAQELVAEGLVAALKLEPGKKYMILIDRRSISSEALHYMIDWMRMKSLDGMLTLTAIPPGEAVLGIEIEHCNPITLRDLEVMPYEEIKRAAMETRGIIEGVNSFEAQNGGLLTYHLAEMAYSCCWYGSDYPRIIIATAPTVAILLSKIRNGPEVKGDCIGWVDGKCWFHGAQFFVIPDWPVGEMFFFNPFRRGEARLNAVITGIKQ